MERRKDNILLGLNCHPVHQCGTETAACDPRPGMPGRVRTKIYPKCRRRRAAVQWSHYVTPAVTGSGRGSDPSSA